MKKTIRFMLVAVIAFLSVLMFRPQTISAGVNCGWYCVGPSTCSTKSAANYGDCFDRYLEMGASSQSGCLASCPY